MVSLAEDRAEKMKVTLMERGTITATKGNLPKNPNVFSSSNVDPINEHGKEKP
ncbi:hypothetical protein TorRG33x02_281020 [Trema orientale]|uniref:Uncharacterized protein n=1 Tax=Trema orientale TaxID=63057 RepID=A0A2P5CL83_TREOI|nr:hypothetical protein TorRG33x02_281020 [Trema orientale]